MYMCNECMFSTDIRIPLEWRELDSSKTKAGKVGQMMLDFKQDYCVPACVESHFGVFCLFKIGNQVMDSSSLVSVDRTTMDIVFREPVIL